MKILSSLFIAASLSLAGVSYSSIALAQASAASSVSEAQKSALTQRLNNMDAALLSGDLDRIVEVVAPEPFTRALGTGFGVPESEMGEFIQVMDELMRATMEISTITSHNVDYNNITFGLSPTNTPIATIPFEMEMEISGQSFISSGDYYGVLRDDWMVISVPDENTAGLIKTVIPELVNTEIVVSAITPKSGLSK